jgi:hypothetical protein
LDAVREVKPPFSPEATVEEFARLLRSYRCTSVYGDRYAGEWPREQFRRHQINYEPSDRSKSELFLDFLPLVNSGGVDLLDHNKMMQQFVALERRTLRGGKDTVDHPRGVHDDLANAVAGAVTIAAKQAAGWKLERFRKFPQSPIITRSGGSGSRPTLAWMGRYSAAFRSPPGLPDFGGRLPHERGRQLDGAAVAFCSLLRRT